MNTNHLLHIVQTYEKRHFISEEVTFQGSPKGCLLRLRKFPFPQNIAPIGIFNRLMADYSES